MQILHIRTVNHKKFKILKTGISVCKQCFNFKLTPLVQHLHDFTSNAKILTREKNNSHRLTRSPSRYTKNDHTDSQEVPNI